MESAIFGSSQVQSLGAWNYFLSFPEQFPQVLKAGNSIYMKFEHKKNIQIKLMYIFALVDYRSAFKNIGLNIMKTMDMEKENNSGFAKFNKMLNLAD